MGLLYLFYNNVVEDLDLLGRCNAVLLG
jgi:hypothetical protein